MFIAATNWYKRFSGMRSRKIAEKVLPYLPEEGRLLDFGCGNFFTAKEIAAHKPSLSILGLDVIQDQNLSLNGNSRLEFLAYEGKVLPFPDNSFDAALASSALHHTPDPEFFLAEMVRVVRPGGSLILVEEMYINPLDQLWISAQDLLLNKLKKGVPVPLEFRSHRHYLAEFNRQGLEVLEESFIRPSFPYQHHYVFHLRVPGQ